VPNVVLYGRAGCHLCDVAREVILAVRLRHAFEFTEVDIDGSDDLVRAYGLRVPVVAVDGVEAFEVEVPPAGLEALVGGR